MTVLVGADQPTPLLLVRRDPPGLLDFLLGLSALGAPAAEARLNRTSATFGAREHLLDDPVDLGNIDHRFPLGKRRGRISVELKSD